MRRIEEADPGVLLGVEGVSKRFGGLQALNEVSLTIRRGTLHAVIGPNGSGKTTLFNVLSGVLPADGGTVWFQGQDVTRLAPRHRARLGMRRTFQQVRLFGSLTVRQNVLAAYLESQRVSLGRRILSYSDRRGPGGHVDEILDFFRLTRFADTACSSLPYGVQKITEMARAMVARPQILLLDEPVNGMNAAEVVEVAELFRKMRAAFDVTILLIEHNMSLVMQEADTASVLSGGLNLAEGTPEQICCDERVIEAYLGKRGGVTAGSGG